LAGCYNKRLTSAVQDQVGLDFEEAQFKMERARVPGRPENADTISISDDIWLGDTARVNDHVNPLPRIFETDSGITMMTEGNIDFNELIAQIQFLTNIPIRPDDNITNIPPMAISYSGPLSGLLTMIGNKNDFSWSYVNDRIEFFRFRTRTFVVHTLANEVSFTSGVSAGHDGTANVSSSISLREWAEIGEIVKGIVGNSGSAIASPSTNSITVTSTPKLLTKVESYIKEVNRRFAKQVAVSVKVLQVSVNRGTDFGISYEGIFGNNNPRWNFRTGGPAAGNLLFNVVDGADQQSAIIQALSNAGRTSVITSATVTARNNRVVPINNTRKTKYIASISTLTENTNSTTEVTPGEEVTGFSMQVMPNILDNGNLILMFNMSLSEIIQMKEITVGSPTSGTTIQLPIVDKRNFMQELVMKSGQTAVLAGFEKTRNENSTSGVGAAEFTWIGGNNTAATERDILVVMLTPQIIESPISSEPSPNDPWGMPSF